MKRRLIVTLILWLCCDNSFFAQVPLNHFVTKGLPSNRQKSINTTKSAYQLLLQTWCDGLVELQVKTGKNEGGIFCDAHQFVHGRCGDAVYPLLTLFHLTGEAKYKIAALKLYNWSETHVSQTDGSWINETGGKNPWKGISVFSIIALGEVLRLHANTLEPDERNLWKERLRKGGDFILGGMDLETGDINYPNSASAALAICWKVLGDEKYLVRAREFAQFSLQHFTANNLIWGEGIRSVNDTTPKGLRPIDIPYNMEESLPNLALYATITGDKKILRAVKKSMQAHLNFILPDGGLDAGWCGRQYKWTYFGSTTADGVTGGLALMSHQDKRFATAAYRNLKLMQSYTHNGLLYGGSNLFQRNLPACSHHTFASAKGIATAIDAGIATIENMVLPSDAAFGVKAWPEASVLQIAVGDWRASVTTSDIASSKKRGGHPMGGALSMLWHKQAGPIAVASMNDYVLYEGSNMQAAKKENDKYCLTPRLEVVKDGIRYSNLYDTKATMVWAKKHDTVSVKINGILTDMQGNTLPKKEAAFDINYSFTPSSFSMAARSKSVDAKLVFPVISPASENVTGNGDNQLSIQKKSAQIKFMGSKMEIVNDNRVFNFVPGFEALATVNNLDENGDAFIKIEIEK